MYHLQYKDQIYYHYQLVLVYNVEILRFLVYPRSFFSSVKPFPTMGPDGKQVEEIVFHNLKHMRL
jgi:hypothetical protein